MPPREAVLAPVAPAGPPPERLTLGRGLFLASSCLAPVEILLYGSFTLYDLLTTALFVLALGRGRLSLPTAGILTSGLLFVAVALLGLIGSIHPEESLTQVLQYLFIFFVQLPVILVLTRSRSMVRAALVAFMLGTIAGIAGAYLFPHEAGAGRVSAIFAESPNRLGYPVAYLAPFLCWMLLERWRAGRRRVVAAIGGAVIAYLMLWALGASGSRGAAAGTLVGLAIFLGLRRGLSLQPAGLARLAAAAAAVAACGALLFLSDHFPRTLEERIDRTLAAESSLVQDRVMLAGAGWRAFRESPLLGVGLDNFRYVGDRYAPTVTQQLPHNLWIQLLVHTGLLGSLAFLGILVCWFRTLLRAQRRERAGAERELLWACVASMSAILTIFLFIPVLIQRQYWWVFGLGLAAARAQAPGAALSSGAEGHEP